MPPLAAGWILTMARRCPYLEQIILKRVGPVRRYSADCHVSHHTETFTFIRHPSPPCLTDYEGCRLFQRQHDEENRSITRYTD